jgi:hypothetical protein
MTTRKDGAAPTQMPEVTQITERVRAHIAQPQVAGFTIGYCSGPPEKRVRGSDHRDHARTECTMLASCLTSGRPWTSKRN